VRAGQTVLVLGASGGLAARVRELAPGGVDAVFDRLGGASITRSYRLLNRTAPWSHTASRASSMTPAPCCPDS
jgi:NADPH:quinone reductase-like Zn-dependent oxidoreductase